MTLARQFIIDSRASEDTVAAAVSLFEKAFAERDGSDDVLKRHARNWDLERLALVDRNILRLAVYEMSAATAPPKVVISEALRLAQEFSTDKSPQFVNGVLDAVYKEFRRERQRAAEHQPRDEGNT